MSVYITFGRAADVLILLGCIKIIVLWSRKYRLDRSNFYADFLETTNNSWAASCNIPKSSSVTCLNIAPAENDDRILKIIPIVSQKKILGDSSLSSLKQTRTGVLPNDVIYKIGYDLIIKSNTTEPACISSSTALKLLSREWGVWPWTEF